MVLIKAREKVFLLKNNSANNITFALKEIKNIAKRLLHQPKLYIYEEISDDDFSLLGGEVEELSGEALNEIHSLLNRYQTELENTMVLAKQKNAVATLLEEKIQSLEHIIFAKEKEVNQTQLQTSEKLKVIIIILLAFLVFFLLSNHYLQHKMVLRPLRLLRNSFLQLIEQGQVNSIKNICKNTELGEIALSFNSLVTQLEQDDKDKAHQLSLVSNTLHIMQDQASNIHQSSASTSK